MIGTAQTPRVRQTLPSIRPPECAPLTCLSVTCAQTRIVRTRLGSPAFATIPWKNPPGDAGDDRK
jgi:hypothetical protein